MEIPDHVRDDTEKMDRVIKFIILIISIIVGLGISLLFITFLSPLLAGGIFLWIIAGTFIAFVMFLIKFFLGVWLFATDEEKVLTKSDKNFSIKQGKDISK